MRIFVSSLLSLLVPAGFIKFIQGTSYQFYQRSNVTICKIFCAGFHKNTCSFFELHRLDDDRDMASSVDSVPILTS